MSNLPPNHIDRLTRELSSDLKPIVTFWDEERSLVKSIRFINARRALHRDHGPALMTWFKDGTVDTMAFFKDGKEHNPQGAALKRFFKDGKPWTVEFFLEGEFHNENGPALREFNEEGKETWREFWIHGKRIYDEKKFKVS